MPGTKLAHSAYTTTPLAETTKYPANHIASTARNSAHTALLPCPPDTICINPHHRKANP